MWQILLDTGIFLASILFAINIRDEFGLTGGGGGVSYREYSEARIPVTRTCQGSVTGSGDAWIPVTRGSGDTCVLTISSVLWRLPVRSWCESCEMVCCVGQSIAFCITICLLFWLHFIGRGEGRVGVNPTSPPRLKGHNTQLLGAHRWSGIRPWPILALKYCQYSQGCWSSIVFFFKNGTWRRREKKNKWVNTSHEI